MDNPGQRAHMTQAWHRGRCKPHVQDIPGMKCLATHKQGRETENRTGRSYSWIHPVLGTDFPALRKFAKPCTNIPNSKDVNPKATFPCGTSPLGSLSVFVGAFTFVGAFSFPLIDFLSCSLSVVRAPHSSWSRNTDWNS